MRCSKFRFRRQHEKGRVVNWTNSIATLNRCDVAGGKPWEIGRGNELQTNGKRGTLGNEHGNGLGEPKTTIVVYGEENIGRRIITQGFTERWTK